MSFIAAAAVGIAAGAVGTGFIFNYTKNEYQQKINHLETLVNALQEHLDDMKELRDQVPNFWNDEKGRAVATELNRTILETEREMETVKTYIATLTTVVSELDGSQGVIGKTLDDLRELVSMGSAD